MNREEIRVRLGKQDKDDRKNMIQTLKISEAVLERQMRDPEALSEEQFEQVRHWLLGDYGFAFGTEGRTLIKRPKPQTLPAPALPTVAAGSPADYGDPAHGDVRAATGCRPYMTKRGGKVQTEAKPKPSIMKLPTFGRA